jgi:hypothetical protein
MPYRAYAPELVRWWQRNTMLQEIIEQMEQLKREKIAQGKPNPPTSLCSHFSALVMIPVTFD